jgi:hypothetical protein
MVPQKTPVAILRPALRNEPISAAAGLPSGVDGKRVRGARTAPTHLALDRKQSDSIYKEAQAKSLEPDRTLYSISLAILPERN